MAGNGKLDVEIEVKSSADEFWGSIRDSTTLFPKAFSHDYKSIQVLEGDGKAPGSVRHFTYAEGSPVVKASTEKIEAVDEANKVVTYKVIDGDLLKYYRSFEAIISVTPKPPTPDGGSLVKWGCAFEKATDDTLDPSVIKDFVIKNFKEVDDYINNAHQSVGAIGCQG